MEQKEEYGIAAALSEALEAVVFADCSSTFKSYDLIEKYAYDEFDDNEGETTVGMNQGNNQVETEEEKEGRKELAMAKFSMKDSNGQSREISIPLITMMPLPLLHVTEATFDIEMKASLVEAKDTTTNTQMKSKLRDNSQTIKPIDDGQIKKDPIKKDPIKKDPIIKDPTQSRLPIIINDHFYQRKWKKKLSELIRPTFANTTGRVISITEKHSESNSSDINIRVNVKLEQAELPAGIKLMLQAAANCIQSEAVKLNEQ